VFFLRVQAAEAVSIHRYSLPNRTQKLFVGESSGFGAGLYLNRNLEYTVACENSAYDYVATPRKTSCRANLLKETQKSKLYYVSARAIVQRTFLSFAIQI
jgi:hypothetical protein